MLVRIKIYKILNVSLWFLIIAIRKLFPILLPWFWINRFFWNRVCCLVVWYRCFVEVNRPYPLPLRLISLTVYCYNIRRFFAEWRWISFKGVHETFINVLLQVLPEKPLFRLRLFLISLNCIHNLRKLETSLCPHFLTYYMRTELLVKVLPNYLAYN
jgi:hypothetical protein